MARLADAIGLGHLHERDAARRQLSELWELIGAKGDPLHRCAVAHSMADVQDDPNNALLWGLRALQAADLLRDDRTQEAGMSISVAGFYPSLHLNLA